MNLKKIYKFKNICRLCYKKNLIPVIDLKKTPLANSFSSKIKKKELTVPLKAYFCKNCFHLQLLHIVNPNLLFNNYLYVTGTSAVTVKHFKKYSKEVKKFFLSFSGRKKILDIASNDGTFLKNFAERDIECYGIDPAKNLNLKISDKKIKTITGFFNSKFSKKIKKKIGKFDVITANNVFAHVDNLNDFTKGVKNLLKENGVFIFEVSYLLDVLKKNAFDTIYHEHLSFHSYYSLINFFKKENLRIFNVKRIQVQGGSMRFYVCNIKAKYKNSKYLKKILYLELNKFKINKIATYNKFQKNIDNIKIKVNHKIDKLKKLGKIIGGYGAAAKTTTLLNYFDIDYKKLDFIVDDNPLKQNLYTPGTGIKIVRSNYIYKNKIDYIFVLSWNYYHSIKLLHKKFISQGGQILKIY
jgi:2-polyprenyl-3-methyl-5-hydroxy-6-metoxy-1,4-benzoquinol methylase